ncbi:Rv3654c family TadE-like protein [Qaidamihabitans albus]|uniref:Rv3654c family TadE-like protein n=1 Tax=Qaidamihabitans albus TaxID=2795733 RepID=UPI0018F235C0|nr:Rv3654c family TadE-like protein [Qaidamihabitans albus]
MRCPDALLTAAVGGPGERAVGASGRGQPHRGVDDGFATVWAACAIAALLTVAGVLWWLGAAVLTRHRAADAADLAALAAAAHAGRGSVESCEHAGLVAGRMRVRLRECRFEGWDALVIVEARPPAPLALFGPATARARAGPIEAPGLVERSRATSGRRDERSHDERTNGAPPTGRTAGALDEQRSSAHGERSHRLHAVRPDRRAAAGRRRSWGRGRTGRRAERGREPVGRAGD